VGKSQVVTADPREFFRRWLDAMNALDFDTLESMLLPDVVSEYPQSGEVVRGFAALRKELESYPGGIPRDSNDVDSANVVEDSERWMITPAYTVVPMSAPGRYTTVVNAIYPDGSRWSIVTVVEMRDDRIAGLRSFFAPHLPAPLAESIASFPHG
jgi:hypothetical protein